MLRGQMFGWLLHLWISLPRGMELCLPCTQKLVSKQRKLDIPHICKSTMPVRPDKILNASLNEVFFKCCCCYPTRFTSRLAADAISEHSVSTVSWCCSQRCVKYRSVILLHLKLTTALRLCQCLAWDPERNQQTCQVHRACFKNKQTTKGNFFLLLLFSCHTN